MTAAVDAILDVVSGLEAASAGGVLHRDVKPSNCFVNPAVRPERPAEDVEPIGPHQAIREIAPGSWIVANDSVLRPRSGCCGGFHRNFPLLVETSPGPAERAGCRRWRLPRPHGMPSKRLRERRL